MEEQIALLGCKDTQIAYKALQKLLASSQASPDVYPWFDHFVNLLSDANSYMRMRGMLLIAANAKWDTEDKLSGVLDAYLARLQDEKPIVARKCLEGLKEIAAVRRDLAPKIRSALLAADFSAYADSMRPLLEKGRQAVLAHC